MKTIENMSYDERTEMQKEGKEYLKEIEGKKLNENIENFPNSELKYWIGYSVSLTQVKKSINEAERLRFMTDIILTEARKYIHKNITLKQLSNSRFDLTVNNCGYLNEERLGIILSKLDFAVNMVKVSKIE